MAAEGVGVGLVEPAEAAVVAAVAAAAARRGELAASARRARSDRVNGARPAKFVRPNWVDVCGPAALVRAPGLAGVAIWAVVSCIGAR